MEENVIQSIAAAWIEDKVKTSNDEVGIAGRVDTEVASTVSAHVQTAVKGTVAGAGIEEKVGAAVDESDVPGRVERELHTKLDSRVEDPGYYGGWD